jgi:hypothetical protein
MGHPSDKCLAALSASSPSLPCTDSGPATLTRRALRVDRPCVAGTSGHLTVDTHTNGTAREVGWIRKRTVKRLRVL